MMGFRIASPGFRGAALGLALLTAALAQSAPPAAAKDIRIATLAPDGTPWIKVLQDFDREVRERTGGALGLKLYPGGVAGDETLVIKKMRAGQLQGAGFTGMGLGEICSWLRLLELPFQYRSYEEVDHVRAKLDARLRAEFERRGYVVLGWAEVGFANLFSNRPLRSVEDVRGAKPWLWEGDPLAAATFKAFGVNPTPLALPDVLTSLQTGLIDTVYASPSACVGLQWFAKVKYMSDVPIGDGTSATLVTKSFFDKLPDDQKQVLLDAGSKHHAREIELTRAENAKAIDEIRAKKIEIVPWDPKDRARFEEIGAKVSEDLAGEGEGKLFPRALLDEVRRHLEEFRSKEKRTGAPAAPGAGPAPEGAATGGR